MPSRTSSSVPVSCVLFDLDGTLVDSLADIADSLNRVLARFGRPTHPRDAYRRFVGDGMPVLCRRALVAGAGDEPIAPALIDDVLAAMRLEYAAHQFDSTRPYEGMPETLLELADRGLRLAVLSNKPHRAAVEVVEGLFGAGTFVAVYGHGPGVPPKPDPAGARALLAGLDVLPDVTALVGDSNADMQTAVAAGLRAVGCLWGFRDREELLGAGADALVETPADLLALFPGSARSTE